MTLLAPSWLTSVKENSDFEQSSKYSVRDKYDVPVVLEWKRVNITSPELAEFKKEVCGIASKTIAPIEQDFLRKHPEAASHEMFLKQCEPLLEDKNNINWTLVKKKIKETIKGFYLTDLTSFGPEMIKPLLNDLYFIVSIRNSELEEIIGFAIFAVTPALPSGNVKVINLIVTKAEQKRHLEQLLMASIYNIIPNISRLFTFTRPTDDRTIKLYKSWGFTEDKSGFEDPSHKINTLYTTQLEYKQDSLQKLATAFIPKI